MNTFDCCPRCEKEKGFAPPVPGVNKIVFTNTLCEDCKKQLVEEKLVFAQEVKYTRDPKEKEECRYTGRWMELDYSNFGSNGMLAVEVPASSQIILDTKVFKMYMDIYNQQQNH